MVTMEKLKKEIMGDKKKEVLILGVLFLVLSIIFCGVAVYKLGAKSQETRINKLALRLDTEQKKVAGWWKKAIGAEAGSQKLQGELTAAREEIALGEKIFASRVTEFEACQKKVAQLSKPPVRPKQVAKKVASAKTPAKATAKTLSPPAVMVPALATTAPQLILRINVVEWASVFKGKSLMSRDIGPVIRQGLANGTIVRTKEALTFVVNNASVSVQDGSAIVDPGPINAETTLVVQPANGGRFASPPNGLPLTTNPGELDAVVKRGTSEIWLNFILAPKKT